MRLILLTVLSVLQIVAYADYLVVSRKATLKAEPIGTSIVIDRVIEGEVLLLLEPNQIDGYYKVRHPNRGTEGWIYRTLVRRFSGDPPGFTGTQNSSSSDLVVHIVDSGVGLCSVTVLPDGRYIIYDAGDYNGYGNTTYRYITEIIPPGSDIELFVLSHTDADHMGAAGHIIQNYRVKTVLHTGYEKSAITTSATDKPTATYSRFTNALNSVTYPINNINLNQRDSTITPGTTLQFNQVRVIFLCGFGKPLPSWGIGMSDYSKLLNSVSIVMKIEYAGRSILFGGDAVGRRDGAPINDLQATELYLIENANDFLKSDVVIAPHHGADNGSSASFIKATSPSHVVFSAGHDHEHPRQTTADRYISYGVPIENIFRTDRGDDEREENKVDKEWAYGRILDCTDSHGDDGIKIVISPEGKYQVNYKNPNTPCGGE